MTTTWSQCPVPKPSTSPTPSNTPRSTLDGPWVWLIKLFTVDIAPLQETYRKTENKMPVSWSKRIRQQIASPIALWAVSAHSLAFGGRLAQGLTPWSISDHFSQQLKEIFYLLLFNSTKRSLLKEDSFPLVVLFVWFCLVLVFKAFFGILEYIRVTSYLWIRFLQKIAHQLPARRSFSPH